MKRLTDVMLLEPNTSVYNFSLTLILQDLRENFTNNEQKLCKKLCK